MKNTQDKKDMKINFRNRKQISKYSIGLFGLLPTLALADTGGFELESILQALINFLNGGIARTIFVLSIVGVGYGWLYMGRIPKGRALGAIIGIGIVFSASYIAQQLGVGS